MIYGVADQCRNVETRHPRSGTSTKSFKTIVFL